MTNRCSRQKEALIGSNRVVCVVCVVRAEIYHQSSLTIIIMEEEEEEQAHASGSQHHDDVGEAGRSRVVPLSLSLPPNPHPHPHSLPSPLPQQQQQQQQLHTPHSEQWRETMNEDGDMIIERGGVRLVWVVKEGRLYRSRGELCLCG